MKPETKPERENVGHRRSVMDADIKLSIDEIQQLRGRFEQLEHDTRGMAQASRDNVNWKDFRRVYTELDILQEEIYQEKLDAVQPTDLIRFLENCHPRLMKVWSERNQQYRTGRINRMRRTASETPDRVACVSLLSTATGRGIVSGTAAHGRNGGESFEILTRCDDLDNLERHRLSVMLDVCESTRFPFQKKIILDKMGFTSASILPPLLCMRPLLANAVRKLSLAGNQIGSIPSSLVRALPALRHLDLSNCEINLLPVLWDLPSLRTLHLSHNRLRNFPDETVWKGLPELLELDLYGNKVFDLQPLIASTALLAKLQVLNIGYNDIAYLPEELAGLTKLKVLKAMNNYITIVPQKICRLHLQTLDLSFNPLVCPPIETCERGIKSMKRFYHCLEKENEASQELNRFPRVSLTDLSRSSNGNTNPA